MVSAISKHRILIVDDEADLVSIFKEVFLSEGFDVVTASDGFEAMKVLYADDKIGVVISDLNMPTLGGRELRIGARKLPDSHQPLKWIALTAHVPAHMQTTGIEFFDETYYKPFSPKMIALSVKKLLFK